MAVSTTYRRRRSWRSVVTVLAAIVVFCTTYALILPAITMEKSPVCGLEEHTHEDACYTSAAVLSCGVHQHGEGCCDGEGKLVCGLADFLVHTHGSDCFLSSGELFCSLPEIAAHTHTDACLKTETLVHQHSEDCAQRERGELTCTMEESAGHTHDDVCREETLTLVCGLEEGEGHAHGEACYLTETSLICGREEDQGHIHGDDCYAWTDTLICGMEEGQETGSESVLVCGLEEILLHTHSDGCYDADGVLNCGMLQIVEHVHSEDCLTAAEEETLLCGLEEHVHDPVLCFIDPEADLEPPAVWESTLPKHLTGIWAEDLLAVAESQVGYKESEFNVQVDAEGFVRGYTRYGAWYAEPYSDWNAIFVSFCLNYANIGRDDFPYESNAERWSTVLAAREQFGTPGEYSPVPGDLVFMDLDDNGYGDTVAILKSLEDSRMTVIQGDTENRSVEQITYLLADAPVETEEKLLRSGDILGYGILPVNPNPDGEAAEATEETETEISEQVQRVIERIDALLTAEEMEAIMATFEEEEDQDGLEAWYTDVCVQVKEVYALYAGLTEEEKAAVTNADKLMQLQFIWAADTLEEPVEPEAAEDTESDIIHDELSVAGAYYHSKDYKYYQISGQRLTQSDVMTFPLIPGSAYSAEWAPNTTSWSAKKDANYLVAYCAECLVMVSDSGSSYDSFSMDNSRFGSSELRKQLAGVIAHSYPYLTLAEMQKELKDAYENGEISVDASGGTASEYMAATQAAIWQMLIPTMNFTSFEESDCITDDALVAVTINPLTDAGSGAYCEEIMRWLMTQAVPDDLAVSTYDYTVEKNPYDMYALTVTGTFNRAIIAGEIVTLQMTAGDQATEQTCLDTGTEGFTLELTGLTAKELIDAVVSLNIRGERMQAYYFENARYQDMIAGQWEGYDNDLSFHVTKDSTSVSVTKHWAENQSLDGASVEVRLYANGSQVQSPVQLNADNGWSYTWPALDKYDALGNPIVYTIQEAPVPGYYSAVTSVDAENQMIRVWEEAESFEDGGQYMLVSDLGGLAAYNQSSTTKRLNWIAAYPGDVSRCDDSLVWTAVAAENGDYYLDNDAVGGRLGYKDLLADIYYRVAPLPEEKSAYWMTFRFHDGILSGTYNTHGNLDFSYIGTNNGDSGCGYFRDYSEKDYSYAQKMTLYRMVEKEVPPSDINFIITNTRIREDIPLIHVSVTKQWAGRPDEVYPESAEVQLLQNGREYDVPVTLNEENGWQYQWMDLPKTDNDGNAFVYTVDETGHEDYSPTQEGTWLEDGTYAIVLTNTWEPEKVTVELRKADLYSGALIDGAEFDLYLATNNQGDPIPGTEDIPGILLESVSMNEEGIAQLELVCGETYYLVETKAPAGYVLPMQAIGFTVSQRGTLVTITLLAEEKWVLTEADTIAVITVLNRADYKLPKTGGAGTTLYTMGGLLLMASAGILLMYSQRKRRKGEY